VLITSLINHAGMVAVSKLEGRVKDKEECIKKFTRKYRTVLETKSEPYTIKDHVTDIIGLRLVCLYEDDIEKVRSVLSEQFDVVDVTNKISQIENTEGSFGYKGLHLDLRLNAGRRIAAGVIHRISRPRTGDDLVSQTSSHHGLRVRRSRKAQPRARSKANNLLLQTNCR
jgi:ppGpp synthetase/RelA/SpoT-type nucleotidyltranferase